jgi:large subunit ribosomal protein L6
MSRIGKNPIKLPEAVKYVENNNDVSVAGPKGTLVFKFHKDIKINNESGLLSVSRKSDSKEDKALHGTSRQILNNMILGVSEGFEKELEIIGVGYQAKAQGSRLHLQLGYSHDIYFDVPDGIILVANRTEIKVQGMDKQLVGAVSAKIRSFRPPEPYKGKGIRYKGENVRSKQGKTVGAK